MDLTELVRQAQAGDAQAMGELYEQTSRRVYALALRLTNDGERAMDVVQETYLAVLQHLDSLRNPEAFLSWTFQIAANRCHRLNKQEGRYVSVPSEEEGDGDFLEAIPDPDEGILPESVADNLETRQLVMKLVDKLPDVQRECVILFYFSRLTVEQIAEIQACSTGTVKSRLNYARKKLKDEVLALEKRDGIRLHTLAPVGLLLRCLKSELPTPDAFSEVWHAVGAGAAGTTAASAASGTAAASSAAGKTTVSTALKLKVVAGLAAGGVLAGVVGVTLHEPALTFSDSAFEQNIRILADVPEGPIRASDVEEISVLYVTADGMATRQEWDGENLSVLLEEGTGPVGSLQDLSLLPHLDSLHYMVEDSGALLNTVTDERLTSVILDTTGEAGQPVSNLAFLDALPSLRHLSIAVAPGTDLTPLEKADSLVELNVSLSGDTLDLSQLTELGWLQAQGTPGTQNALTSSAELPELLVLSLQGYEAWGPSLEVVSHMTALAYFSMDGAYDVDFTPLAQLDGLRAVQLNFDQYPVDLTPLTDCPSLEVCSVYSFAPDSIVPLQLSSDSDASMRIWDIYDELLGTVRDRWIEPDV